MLCVYQTAPYHLLFGFCMLKAEAEVKSFPLQQPAAPRACKGNGG